MSNAHPNSYPILDYKLRNSIRTQSGEKLPEGVLILQNNAPAATTPPFPTNCHLHGFKKLAYPRLK